MIEFLIICGIIALFAFCLIKLKIPKCGSVLLVTGGVKTGKTTASVRIVYQSWKRNVRKVKFYNAVVRHFKKNNAKLDLPVIYSNVPLNIPYVPLTEDLLYRKKRFIYKSVVYLCEASLVAGSMDFNDNYLNDCIQLLVKLIGHELHSGDACLVIDTQSVDDLHYGFKRNLSSYFYIHHKIRLPFFLVLKMRELIYLDGSSNTFESDIEDSMITFIVPTSTWKLFDCYCYSAFTDGLPVEKTIVKPKSLKAEKILTFKKNKNLYQKGGVITNDEKKVSVLDTIDNINSVPTPFNSASALNRFQQTLGSKHD